MIVLDLRGESTLQKEKEAKIETKVEVKMKCKKLVTFFLNKVA